MTSETIEITPILLRALRSEIKRTGVGSTRLSTISKTRGRFIEGYMVANILNEAVKTANSSDLEYILELYQSLPDGRIQITNKMKRHIQDKCKEFAYIPTGALIDHPEKPYTLSANRMEQFLKDQNIEINQDEWDFICHQLDTFKPTVIKELSQIDYDLFENLMSKNKVNTIRLRKFIKVKYGRDFTVPYLQKLHEREITEVTTKDWEILINSLHEIPRIKTIGKYNHNYNPKSATIKGTIPLTAEMITEFNQELERTGIEYSFFLYDVPKGIHLNKQQISRIRKGNVKNICPALWEHLTSTLQKRPNLKIKTKVEPIKRGEQRIDGDHIELLNFYQKDTGFEPNDILNYFPDAPAGLKADTIISWMSGNINSTESTKLKWVLKKYQSLSDIGMKKTR